MALTTDDLKKADFFSSSLVNLYHHLLRPRPNQSAKRFSPPRVVCRLASIIEIEYLSRVTRGLHTLAQYIPFSAALI